MNEKNCKYVSSHGILKSCDIIILSIEDFTKLIENIPNKKDPIIYFNIYVFDILKSNLHLINYNFILVSGDGDSTNPTELFSSEYEFSNFINNEKIIKWYSQNCIIEHSKIEKIPIGLDYHTLCNNSYYWGEKQTPIEQENELINIFLNSKKFWERQIKCYSNFHFVDYGNKFGYSRKDIINSISSELIFYEPIQIERKTTWENQTEYAFVISPHGNGLDCHRTWEALVLGCIVIVKKSPLDSLYEDLPVLIINEWSEINEELLKNTIIEFKNKKFNYEKLLLEYYIKTLSNI